MHGWAVDVHDVAVDAWPGKGEGLRDLCTFDRGTGNR
jgi:hypothetical protein